VNAALLRGVNVGSHGQLPMTELVKMFAAAGCRDVRAYLRSGNVVFDAPATVVRRVPKLVADAIEARFEFRSEILLRDHRELAAIARKPPFPSDDPRALHVAFLAEAPSAAAIAKLDPQRSPGDAFVVRGKEIYLHLTNGAGKSKLSNAYFESKLGTVSTWRNWNTVQKLVEMTGG
jgi:uncharacterized protein (DUF1697 family)